MALDAGCCRDTCFLFLVLLYIIPESPRFLIKIGKIAAARVILEKIEIISVEAEIEEIKQSVNKPEVKKADTLFTSIYQSLYQLHFLWQCLTSSPESMQFFTMLPEFLN